MESIEQNVGDITADERRVFEKVLGHKLQENQRIILQVTDIDASKSNGSNAQNSLSGTNLDDWAIFQDLSDEEVAELESVILERSPGRDIDI
jgi:hypothetical protein